jgi:hypothetical protein
MLNPKLILSLLILSLLIARNNVRSLARASGRAGFEGLVRMKNSGLCTYCLTNPSDSFDHVVPYFYSGKTFSRKGTDHFDKVPCCKGCNSLLHNKMFKRMEERHEYIRQRLGLPSLYPIDRSVIIKQNSRLPQTRQCLNCFKSFRPNTANHSFCSKGCSNEFNLKERPEVDILTTPNGFNP